MTTDNQYAGLIEKVLKVKEEDNLTYATLGKASGIPGKTLSLFLTSQYKGDNARIAKELEQWLSQREESKRIKKALPQSPDFLELDVSKRFMEAMTFAQAMCSIVVVATEPGLSKSTTIRHFAKSRTNAWAIPVPPEMQTLAKMKSKLAAALDIIPGHSSRIDMQLEEKVSDCAGVMIFDESQYLTAPQLNQLRFYNEEYKVGIALFGNQNIHQSIEGRRREVAFAQFYSRVGHRLKIEKPTQKDLLAFIDAWGVTDEKEVKALRAIGNQPGAFRSIDMVMKMAHITAAGAGVTPNISHIADAHKRLTTAGN